MLNHSFQQEVQESCRRQVEVIDQGDCVFYSGFNYRKQLYNTIVVNLHNSNEYMGFFGFYMIVLCIFNNSVWLTYMPVVLQV